MADIIIEKMTAAHIDGICAIENASFRTPWSRSMFVKELSNDLAVYFVALTEGAVAGYAGLWHIVNEGHMNNIAVAEDMRRTGIGQKLLDRIFEEALSREMIGLTLEVASMNKAAQALYLKNGFKMEGLRKGYYADTKDDAIIMWKMFNENP